MDQASFFESRNDFYLPTGCGFHPFEERSGVLRVAQRTRGDYSNLLNMKLLCGAIEPREHFHRLRHRFRSEGIVAKHRFAETRDFAVLVNHLQLAASKLGDFQTDRIGADVNGGEDRHKTVNCFPISSDRGTTLILAYAGGPLLGCVRARQKLTLGSLNGGNRLLIVL